MEKRVRSKKSPVQAKATTPGLYRRGTTYWLKHYVDGHPRRESLRTDDLSLAVAKAEITRRAPNMEESGRWAIEVDLYIAERRRQDRLSVDFAPTRAYALKAQAKKMGWAHPARVTVPMLQSWYDGLREKKTENTAIAYVGHMRGFYTWLVEQKKVRENPAKAVRMTRTRSLPRKNFVAREVVDRLIESCTEPQLKFVLLCGFDAGMRKGEVIAARPDWFNTAAGRIDVRIRPKGTLGSKDAGWKPKNRKERSVPMTERFREFLCSGDFDLTQDFALMPHVKQGANKYRYNFDKPLKAFHKAQKVAGLTFHDYRRTFASLRIMAGRSLVKVAKWLGDGYQVTFEHYSHLIPDLDKDIEL